jgi:hypothetical protein
MYTDQEGKLNKNFLLRLSAELSLKFKGPTNDGQNNFG